MLPSLRILALVLTTALTALAQEDFSRRLTPQERKAAGLDQLSPKQIAALDALVKRDREGRPAPMAAPPTAVTTSVATPAEKPAERIAPPPADNKPEPKKRLFGLPANDDVNAITGVLVGEFRGWNGQTRFRLEDGQVWVQTDHTDIRAFTPRQNARVKIEKAVFGDYKLTVEGSPIWVRVRRME